jgi:hypothetical protein
MLAGPGERAKQITITNLRSAADDGAAGIVRCDLSVKCGMPLKSAPTHISAVTAGAEALLSQELVCLVNLSMIFPVNSALFFT